MLRARFAVEVHDVAMKVDVSRERHRDRLQGAHALQQGVVEQRAVLKPEPRIGFRYLAQHLFINSEHHVNCQITVGMRGELPSRGVSLARVFVELIAARDLEPVIVGNADVRLGKPRGSLRN